jgi:hypothetical protein
MFQDINELPDIKTETQSVTDAGRRLCIYQWQRRIERRLELVAIFLVFGMELVYKYLPESRYPEGISPWFSLFRHIFQDNLFY